MHSFFLNCKWACPPILRHWTSIDRKKGNIIKIWNATMEMQVKCKWNSNFECKKSTSSHRKFVKEIFTWTMKPPHCTIKKPSFFTNKYSKKILNLNNHKKNHSVILDKLISTCLLWLGWFFLLVEYGPFFLVLKKNSMWVGK
jgi:hypothetical protein